MKAQRGLHRRALLLEWFTVGWNVAEAFVAIAAGIIAESVALTGFGGVIRTRDARVPPISTSAWGCSGCLLQVVDLAGRKSGRVPTPRPYGRCIRERSDPCVFTAG